MNGFQEGSMPCREREIELVEHLDGVRNPEFEAHLAECADCQATMAMWQRMGAWADETPDPGMPFRFRQRLNYETKPNWKEWMKWAGVAAAVVVSFFAGRSTTDVTDLRQEVRGLREVVALSLLEQQSASERLRGIRYSAALDKPDDEVIGALTRTLRRDSSVDVRLAAADALRRYARTESVKQAARELLSEDESPMVQVAAIDLLLAARERSGVEKLRLDEKLDNNVRKYLERALRQESWE
jgi:hypothetical protein